MKSNISFRHCWGGGGGDTGVPISHIPDFLPPNIPYPKFFTPNIPYPRFFTPQYPISQISQSIDHIPDFARLECVCIHSFDITIGENGFCWIYLLLLSIYMYMGIWNCILTMYTIQICTWGVIKMHSIIQTLNFTNHRWKITELKICCMLLVFNRHLTK